MASLVIGGVTIPVAVSSPSWGRMDAVDRGRVFDNTLFVSQVGGAAREWDFETPPVTTALADTYAAVLSSPAAKLCSGDILQLPTMCSPELPGGTPVRKSVGHNVVLRFRLHEVQPAKVLLKYAPGDIITGEAFTRSTTAYEINAGGALVSKAINAKRDGHYVNVLGPSTLLEDAAINDLLWSSDFSNAAWTKSGVSVTTGIADPAGGASACTLTATAGPDAFVLQTLAAGSNAVRTNSIWLKRRTGAGVIQLQDCAAVSTPVTLAAFWQRFSVVGPLTTARRLAVIIATSGDEVDAFIAQMEPRSFASSENPTTTVAVTRGADAYSLPFTIPPQEMTLYTKFVEKGTVLAQARVFTISNAAGASPFLMARVSAGSWVVNHNSVAGGVERFLATSAAIGQTVELLVRLFGDGSVDITQSIDGGAPTSGARTAALAMASAWSGQLLWLNGATFRGFIAFQSFKIIAGTRTLEEMRLLL